MALPAHRYRDPRGTSMRGVAPFLALRGDPRRPHEHVSWRSVAVAGSLWRDVTQQTQLAALTDGLDAFARAGGAGFWRQQDVNLPALEALPSVAAAVRAGGWRARDDAIESALRDACDRVRPASWGEAALHHLGLSKEGRSESSLTERQRLAAPKFAVGITEYRRTRRRSDGSYILWRENLYRTWGDKVLTLVAKQLMVVEREGDGVGLSFGSVRDHHIELFRVTDEGRVEHRWHPGENDEWTAWADFEFHHTARDVAAVSAGSEHLEVFVLAADGGVWHRVWWLEHGWGAFDYLGLPFQEKEAKTIVAASLEDRHLDVQVQAVDGALRNNWYNGSQWAILKDKPGWSPMDEEKVDSEVS